MDTLRLGATAVYASTLRLESPADVAGRWETAVRRRLAARAEARWRALRLGDSAMLLALMPEPQQPQIDPFPTDVQPEQRAQRGIAMLGEYADLGIQLNAVVDLHFERFKNLRCTPSDVTSFTIGCREAFNPPRITPQFDVRSGGVVGQRIHLNVDYDTQREFDASNNIQVYYQGLEDEILRRVEVGNVSFNAGRSRFLTGGIPSNNFGVAASGQLGALDFGMIFAQQKGNVIRERRFTIGEAAVQPVERQLADRDFEPQRFFMVRNPRSLPGYPGVDILSFGFGGGSLPDSLRVVDVRVYRYRSTINRPPSESNIAGIPAVALRSDSPQRVGPINWEPLAEGRDYYLDPSGLWFALTQRVDQEDFLAVSYITGTGDTVGTFPAAAVAGRTDTLELIYLPRSGPDVPTFFYELRNAYRIGSTDDITRASVGVELRVGGSQRPTGTSPTFLALLGLAQENDATTFDHYNRLFPRSRDPNAGLPLREFYVIFPSLTPFADPARLPPELRTDSLYRTPVYRLRTEGPAPLFHISLDYDARGGDSRGNVMLGGYQIRLGSERVVVGGRVLSRNADYTINYEVGQITFMRPDSLFPRATLVTVQFEENAAFAVAPTTILGFQSRYDFGEHGSMSALALTQRQRSTFTRPPLGFEPASSLVGSLSGNFQFRPMSLTRLLDALPLVRTESPSLLTIDAEIATSRPSPNQLGVAYVETFEGEGGLFLPLGENLWEYGSRPSSGRGLTATGIDPVLGFADGDAVPLTWQNLIPAATGSAAVQVRAVDIDSTIQLQGRGQQSETVFWAALHPDSIGGITNPVTFAHRWLLPHTPGPRWRSVTQPLSATGIDLTRVEFLDFWVLEDEARTMRNEGVSLVFDFGTLHEDAVAFQPTSFSVGADTIFSGRRRAGEGRLDSERDTLTGAFNAAQHDLGILGDVADTILNADANTVVTGLPLCVSELGTRLLVYFWGSFQPHCTRRNGQLDTEDLNNDQHLDTLVAATGESHIRFVVPIGDPRYEVKSGNFLDATRRWRLYRVPFRSDTVQVGAPDLRQVRAVRMTIIAPGTAEPESTLFFALARMRLVGAPWVKRAGAPIAGYAGNRAELHGEVVASIASTEDFDDLGYTSPPGVTDQGENIGGGGQIGSTQINERSLRLLATDVRVGERAEAYYRFPEGERNFLGYREMRVWARGRGNGWETQDLRFFIKVGQNEDNFYLYRSPIRSVDWLPEIAVSFDRWSALRAQVERAFLSGAPPSGAAACGGDTLAYVACDGPYMVHMRNPAVAPPNLTRVQELAVGMIRDSGNALDSAELWIDDIRLTSVVNTPGYAGSVSMLLTAGDVADLSIGLTRRDGNFRQLGENPSYVGNNQTSLSSTVRLERFGLDRLGIAAPLTIQLDRGSEDPFFLAGTDVRADGISGLRTARQSSASYSLNVRRVRRGTRWWERLVVDNVGVSASWGTGFARSSLSDSRSRLSSLRGDYQLSPPDVSLRYLPGFLRGVLDDLPPFLRNSDMVRGLRDGRLRLSPVTLSFGGSLTRTSATRESFRVPIATVADTLAPVRSTSAVLRNTAALELRPFGSMNLGFNANWDRDLRDYGDSTTTGRVASLSRQRLLGMDVGFIRQRDLNARFSWSPPVSSWLRPRISWVSNFALSRDPSSPIPERGQGDSAGAFRLPTVFANGSSADLAAAIDLSRMLRGVFGDSSGLRKALDRITQLDISRRLEYRSQFDRAGFDPGLGYQLGFDGKGLEQVGGRFANASYRLGQDRLSVALRAPLGLSITGIYMERRASTWFLRTAGPQEQRQVEKEWPNIQARWLLSPRAAWIRKFVTSVSTNAGITQRSAVSDQLSPEDGGIGLRSEQTSRAMPTSVLISWAAGINTSWSRSNDRTIADRSGNRTRSDRGSNGIDVSFAFRPPQEVVPLPSDIRTTLRWMHSTGNTCIERAGSGECSVVADSRRSEYNLNMDTQLPPNVTAGLSIGYVLSDDRHVNRKFSQFTLTLTGRVSFAAGEIR